MQAWPFDVVWPGKQEWAVSLQAEASSQGAVGAFSLPPRDISETGDKGQRGTKSQPTCDKHSSVQEKHAVASLRGFVTAFHCCPAWFTLTDGGLNCALST